MIDFCVPFQCQLFVLLVDSKHVLRIGFRLGLNSSSSGARRGGFVMKRSGVVAER